MAPQDPLRDSPARYVAFTSDVGEAFKMFISRRLYVASYAVVAAYGLLDTAAKGRQAYERAAAASLASSGRLPAGPAPLAALPPAAASVAAACAAYLPHAHVYAHAAASSITEYQPAAVPVAAAVLDTLLWHSAASIAIPAALINRTVWATRALLARPCLASRLPARAAALAPSAAGLALIPLVVPHIDEAVTAWFEAHVRPRLPPAAHSP